MNQTIFSENLKKYRIAKNYTQEQVAETLGVNTQTVSRWECGTTLPDVLTLPSLARLYEVTVDDFYKKVRLHMITTLSVFHLTMKRPMNLKILCAVVLNIKS